MAEKKGFFGKLLGGSSKPSGFGSTDSEPSRRIEPRIVEERREEDEPGQLWKKAKKWREDQAMNEPLVKRNQYKKKY
jgi:hypothetical protein